MRNRVRGAIADGTAGQSRVGAQLSGGIDSAFVAALARDLYPDLQLFAFAEAGPNPTGEDERTAIGLNAAKIGGELHIVPQYEDDYFPKEGADWLRMGCHFERMVEHARSQGVTAILSGAGGDQFISYGGRTVVDAWMRKARFRTAWRWHQQSAHLRAETISLSHFARKALHAHRPHRHPIMLPRQDTISRSFRRSPAFQQIARSYAHHSRVPREHGALMRSRLLMNVEWSRVARETEAASRYGIQMVYPLLDARVVSMALGAPPQAFVAGGLDRSILRRAAEGLIPDQVRLRPNKGAPPWGRRGNAVAHQLIGADLSDRRAGPTAQSIFDIPRFQKRAEQFSKQLREGVPVRGGLVPAFRLLKTLDWMDDLAGRRP